MRAGPGRAPSPGQSAARAGSGEPRAGEGARASATLPQLPHPAQARIPAGTKGPRPPPPARLLRAGPAVLLSALCIPVCRSLSPSVSLLVPLPLSSVPQTRSPVSLSVPLSPCLPVPHLYILSLSPTSVPWTLSLFSGSLCPPSSSVFPLLCPSVFLPSLSACLAVTLVSLSLFLCPIPCLPVPYLSVIPVSLAPLCHLSISFLRLSSSLCPTISLSPVSLPPLSILTTSILGSPSPSYIPASLYPYVPLERN